MTTRVSSYKMHLFDLTVTKHNNNDVDYNLTGTDIWTSICFQTLLYLLISRDAPWNRCTRWNGLQLINIWKSKIERKQRNEGGILYKGWCFSQFKHYRYHHRYHLCTKIVLGRFLEVILCMFFLFPSYTKHLFTTMKPFCLSIVQPIYLNVPRPS